MATLRDIKRRIVGIKNTQQITKAMKMVSAARLRRAQENIINARPYSRKLEEVLHHLVAAEGQFSNPFYESREVSKIAVILITSDKGLCGGFNMNAIRGAEDLISGELKQYHDSGSLSLYCIGKKGDDYFKRRGYNIEKSYTGIFSNLKFEFVSALVSEITAKYLKGEVDKIHIVYNEFKSAVQHNLIVDQFLPIGEDKTMKKRRRLLMLSLFMNLIKSA